MSRKYMLFFVLLVVGLAVNLNIPNQIVDKVYMVTVVGYDYVDEDTIKGTVVAPDFAPERSVNDLLYTDTASMIYENRQKLNAKASQELVNGKVEVALYNKELARHGLKDYIDFLQRDSGIGAKLFVGVVDGSSYELMDQTDDKKGTGIFLSDMIESNIKYGNIPATNLKMLTHALYSKLSDPFLPELSMEEGVPSLTGIAFFDEDKYVHTIPVTEGLIFSVLVEKVQNGKFNFKHSDYKMVIENVKSSKKVQVKQKKGNPEVTINISFRGSIKEFTGSEKLSNKLPRIQKDLNKNFNKRAKKLIETFQELNIDPLEIKEHIKSSGMDYTNKELDELYPEISIKTDIDTKVIEYGTRR